MWFTIVFWRLSAGKHVRYRAEWLGGGPGTAVEHLGDEVSNADSYGIATWQVGIAIEAWGREGMSNLNCRQRSRKSLIVRSLDSSDQGLDYGLNGSYGCALTLRV